MPYTMIKIVGRDGAVYNLNLEAVAAIQYADPSLPPAKQFDVLIPMGSAGQHVQLTAGSFAAAVAALKAEYAPKLKDEIFIGTLP